MNGDEYKKNSQEEPPVSNRRDDLPDDSPPVEVDIPAAPAETQTESD